MSGIESLRIFVQNDPDTLEARKRSLLEIGGTKRIELDDLKKALEGAMSNSRSVGSTLSSGSNTRRRHPSPEPSTSQQASGYGVLLGGPAPKKPKVKVRHPYLFSFLRIQK